MAAVSQQRKLEVIFSVFTFASCVIPFHEDHEARKKTSGRVSVPVTTLVNETHF